MEHTIITLDAVSENVNVAMRAASRYDNTLYLVNAHGGHVYVVSRNYLESSRCMAAMEIRRVLKRG